MTIAFGPQGLQTSLTKGPANDVTFAARAYQGRLVPLRTARPYQERLVRSVIGAFQNGVGTAGLFCCPNAGKTFMSQEVITRMVHLGLIRNALVLAHGTNVLRDQYEEDLAKYSPDLVPFVDVAIPQALHDKKDLPQYDLVVVDEAHQFYGVDGGMNERILKAVKAKYVLLLTGSPSKFIAQGFKAGQNMFCFSLQELRQEEPEAVADVIIEVATASYSVKQEDYTSAWGEVRSDFNYTQTKTNATFDDVLATLVKRLQLKLGDWNFVLSKLRKTVVAMPSIKAADQAERYFKKNGVKCVVSHSEDGADEDTIKKFKKDDSITLLIVVNRAQLGFDFSELFHFVDMTGSRNPDRIFQMLCRVVRCSKKDPRHNKLFVKVMSRAFPGDHVRAFMSGVLSLVQKEHFEKWNGKGFSLVEVPVKKEKRKGGGSQPGPRPEPKGPKTPVLEPGMRMFGDYFKALEHNPDDPLAVYAMVKLGDVVGLSMTYNPEAADQWMTKLRGFVELNGRRPSSSAKAPEEERRLCLAIHQMAIPTTSRYRPEVAEYWKSLPTKEDLHINEIRSWISAHGSIPSFHKDASPEELLLASRVHRLAKRRSDFRSEILAAGWMTRATAVEKNIQAIKDHYAQTSSLPQEGTRLFVLMCNYCYRNGPCYRADFDTWARQRGFGSRAATRVVKTKAMIIGFWTRQERWPKFRVAKERKLAAKLSHYCNPNSSMYDPAFRAECAKLDPERFGS